MLLYKFFPSLHHLLNQRSSICKLPIRSLMTCRTFLFVFYALLTKYMLAFSTNWIG